MSRGWPVVAGGTGCVPQALASIITAHGGRIHVDQEVTDLAQLTYLVNLNSLELHVPQWAFVPDGADPDRPEVPGPPNRLVLDLRQVAGSLGAVSAKLDEDPAGAILGGRTLPDYKPETK